jgi:hypothetical protein
MITAARAHIGSSSNILAGPNMDPANLWITSQQSGDTLPALAGAFQYNRGRDHGSQPDHPARRDHYAAGFPMKIPIYYLALWGTAYQSLPDHAFVNGPFADRFQHIRFCGIHKWLAERLPHLRWERKCARARKQWITLPPITA